MGSSSGTSSGSSQMQNSASEEDLQRKRKRMVSNRESARRSRMRKQQHVDDLTAQIAQLRKENNQIMTSVSISTQRYQNVEADNSVLRAQYDELSHRLESLNEIISFVNPLDESEGFDLIYPMNNMFYLNQPVVPPADMLL